MDFEIEICYVPMPIEQWFAWDFAMGIIARYERLVMADLDLTNG